MIRTLKIIAFVYLVARIVYSICIRSAKKSEKRRMKEMGAPQGQPLKSGLADLIASTEDAAKRAQLEHIREEMYRYGVSQLNVEPAKARELADIAVRVAETSQDG